MVRVDPGAAKGKATLLNLSLPIAATHMTRGAGWLGAVAHSPHHAKCRPYFLDAEAGKSIEAGQGAAKAWSAVGQSLGVLVDIGGPPVPQAVVDHLEGWVARQVLREAQGAPGVVHYCVMNCTSNPPPNTPPQPSPNFLFVDVQFIFAPNAA